MADAAEAPPAGYAAPEAAAQDREAPAEGQQDAPGIPCLYVPQWAGRGELSRLIACVGGLEIIEDASAAVDRENFCSEAAPEIDEEDPAVVGTVAAILDAPILGHGDLMISQSFAIEQYIARSCPRFHCLLPEHKAMDNMFCKLKEEVLQGFWSIFQRWLIVTNSKNFEDDGKVTILFDESKRELSDAELEAVHAVGDKWFPIIEGILPEKGFINKGRFPTPADLAVYNMSKAFMPFRAMYKLGKYDVWEKFPKFAALGDKVGQHKALNGYGEKSTTLTADPFEVEVVMCGNVERNRISAQAKETAALWHSVDCPVPDVVVVWLHGVGETEIYWQEVFEMNGLMGEGSIPELGEIRWVMPRALISPCTAREGQPTYQWFDTIDYPVCQIVPGVPDRPRTDENPEEIAQAVNRIHEAILALEVEGIHPEKIVVAGFGQGGALAVHAATSYCKALGGVAMLSGYVPCIKHLEKSSTPEGLQTELLWLHGIHDAVVQTDCATAQAKELQLELGIPLDFRLSFDHGHETTPEELQGFRSWLIKKLKEPDVESSEEEEDSEEEAQDSEPESPKSPKAR